VTDSQYSVPTANLEIDSAEESRPKIILVYISIAVTSFTIGVIHAILDIDTYKNIASIEYFVLSFSIGFLIKLAILYQIWIGRNWARIISLFFIFSAIYTAYKGMYGETDFSMASWIVVGCQLLAQFVAVSLLFSPKSNRWFKAINEERRRIWELQRDS